MSSHAEISANHLIFHAVSYAYSASADARSSISFDVQAVAFNIKSSIGYPPETSSLTEEERVQLKLNRVACPLRGSVFYLVSKEYILPRHAGDY